jgi:hypothetical protein
MNATSNATVNYIYMDSSIDPLVYADVPAYDIFLTTLGLLTAISSLISITVLASPNLADPTFKCMMCIEISDFAYFIQVAYQILISDLCEVYPFVCGSTAQYVSLISEILINNYLTSCLAIFSIIYEVFLTLQRLFLIRNINHLKHVTVRQVTSVLALIAAIYYIPALFTNQIILTGNVYVYRNATFIERTLVNTEFATTGKPLFIALQVIRMLLVTVILFTLNVITAWSFHQFMRKRVELTGGGGK